MAYLVVKYFHVIFVLALMAGTTIEFAILGAIRRSSNAQELTRAIEQFFKLRWIYIPGYLGIIATGAYLGSVIGNESSQWLAVAFASLLLMMVFGGVLSGRSFSKARQLLKANADEWAATRAILNGFAVHVSLWMRLFLILGIFTVISYKPNLVVSIIMVCFATGTGFFVALLRRKQLS